MTSVGTTRCRLLIQIHVGMQ